MRPEIWLAVGLAACAARPAPTRTAAASATPVTLVPGPPAPAGVVSIPQPATAEATAPSYRACGELACKAFPSSRAAFRYVLSEAPRVLAIGEAHAQSGSPGGVSTTRRFMEQLLPELAPRASDLVIELWLANGSCGEVEQKVEKQQREVTAPQAASNQGEFIELGHRAKALGIMPHALVPSCEQYRKIAGAGAGDIEEMLSMIKTVTAHDLARLLSERAPDRLVVAYGGAMHNDLVPRPGREDFTFGPELAATTGDRYVELDLVSPEQIKDNDAWRSLPWYAHYSPQQAGDQAYLYSWAPHAYALIFPPARSDAGAR